MINELIRLTPTSDFTGVLRQLSANRSHFANLKILIRGRKGFLNVILIEVIADAIVCEKGDRTFVVPMNAIDILEIIK